MSEKTKKNYDFDELFKINVNEYTEEKNGLTYLSWSNAWAEVKKIYPDATYEIVKFENGLPYVFDEKTGYMVFTKVVIDGLTHEMWLPVMDGANKAMKDKPYTYKVKNWNNYTKTYEYKEKTVEPATMFDINKTIMRCLVKNLAMFGLGLYIYSGEDLPDTVETENAENVEAKEEKPVAKIVKPKTTVISKNEEEIDIHSKVGGNGKYKDKTWIEVHQENPTYLQWCIDNSKTETSKKKFKAILDKIEETKKEALDTLRKANTEKDEYITISDEEMNTLFN